jgi:predicted transcriptional regulator
MSDEINQANISAIKLATEITVAWLNNPNSRVVADEIPTFFEQIHKKIDALANSAVEVPVAEEPQYEPAVPVRSSVKPDYLLSLITGKKFKSLKRHLATHGLTPDQYRERYGLKADYPMVAANYSAHRRAVAEKLGLGRRPSVTVAAQAAKAPEVVAATPAGAEASAKPTAKVAKAKPASARKTSAAAKTPTVREKANTAPASDAVGGAPKGPRTRLKIRTPKADKADTAE